MLKNKLEIKYIIMALLFLLVLKIGINYLYAENLLSPEQIRYVYYTQKMEKIDSEQFREIIVNPSEQITVIYMGRNSCPTCVEIVPKINEIFEKYKTIELNGETVTINQYYFDSEVNNNSLAKELRQSIHADTVPVIIIINEGTVTLFESDKLFLTDYLETFKQILVL